MNYVFYGPEFDGFGGGSHSFPRDGEDRRAHSVRLGAKGGGTSILLGDNSLYSTVSTRGDSEASSRTERQGGLASPRTLDDGVMGRN